MHRARASQNHVNMKWTQFFLSFLITNCTKFVGANIFIFFVFTEMFEVEACSECHTQWIFIPKSLRKIKLCLLNFFEKATNRKTLCRTLLLKTLRVTCFGSCSHPHQNDQGWRWPCCVKRLNRYSKKSDLLRNLKKKYLILVQDVFFRVNPCSFSHGKYDFLNDFFYS